MIRILCQYQGFHYIHDDLKRINCFKIHIIFHLAAQANVRYCEMAPDETSRCNEKFTVRLLQCFSTDPVHFIYVSSSSVYGSAPTPWGPDTCPQPKSAYGFSKLRCEKLVREAVLQRDGMVTIIRPFSIVGPGIRPDLAPAIFADCLIHRDIIEIYGDGSARRDFTHVNDLVDALLHTMNLPFVKKLVKIFPIGRGEPRSVNELLKILTTMICKKPRVIHCFSNQNELCETYADTKRLQQELGFRPCINLDVCIQDMMLHPKKVQIVVVVATRYRENLLRSRSLPSIQKQSRPADRVCIVIDENENSSSKDEHPTDLEQLRLDFPGFRFIRNQRAPGPGGAWNSGIMAVTDLPEVQKYCYLAILDDDDFWEPNHLELCFGKVQNGLTDLVVSGIIRHENAQCRAQSIPNDLKQSDFFVGNPHIQGSNLFLSLRLFYRAGMFDEYLPSTTDRDLCIRLFDVANDDLLIQSTGKHTVHHFADSVIPRLSSPSSRVKEIGLRRFAYKHERRMTPDQRKMFWARARELFHVYPELAPTHVTTTPANCPKHLATPHEEENLPVGHKCSVLWNLEVISLLFGVISHKSDILVGLIQDIAQIPNSRLVILANGVESGPFKSLLQRYNVAGTVLENNSTRLSIAEARTRLQLFCGKLWKKMISIDAVVIMDDDKRIPEGWFQSLCRLLRDRDKPDGGFLGPDIGSPPLPAAFIARTSLLDLFYAKLGKPEFRCDLEGEDLFYDLSAKGTSHLEFPMAYDGVVDEESISLVMTGIPPVRKASPLQDPVQSIERGGCCVVLRADLLIQYPNPKKQFGDVDARRSDMLWVASTKRTFIKHPALSVYHDRTRDEIPTVDVFLTTAKQDILGSALCRPRESRALFLEIRLKQLAANIIRTQGILDGLLSINNPALLHFSYNRWVDVVIRPIFEKINEVVACTTQAIVKSDPEQLVEMETTAALNDFRKVTAKQLLLRDYPFMVDADVIGLGSEGVVLHSTTTTPALKYKVLDSYKPRSSTFSGNRIPGCCRRKPYSNILVCTFHEGDPYVGGCGSGIVSLLRDIYDAKLICFRNWKPKNLVVVCGDKVSFIDYGGDVVAYTDGEFLKMVERAFLTWRFPNDEVRLNQYFQRSLKHTIPPLEGVELLLEAIHDRNPDNDLYTLLEKKINEGFPGGKVLDFGSGKAKLQRFLGNRLEIVSYDPKVCYRNSVINDLTQLREKFHTVVCARVLCILPPVELETVLAQIRTCMLDSGRAIFTICDPRGVVADCHDGERSFSYMKTVSTNKSRMEWCRPLRLVCTALIRSGFQIEEEFTFRRVHHESFEKVPDQWCCIARMSPKPRHDILIKTCFMEHQHLDIVVQHLVETLPCGLRTILVIDGKQTGFVREYDTSDEVSFRAKARKLLDNGWVDILLEPPNKKQISDLHLSWFGIHIDFTKRDWTHDDEGVQYASTFHGFDACSTEFVLQVDSDIMVFRGDGSPTLPYSLFDSDTKALTWSLPIAGNSPLPLSTGHRLEVRGCLLHIQRLRDLFRIHQHRVQSVVGKIHWYRIVDLCMGDFHSYRGGQQFPYFVHPKNELKKNKDDYFLAIDTVQSGRVSPKQFGKVDWIGCPPDGRMEPFVILVCGRNVPPGRMLRCLHSIKRNMDNQTGVVIIDDASDRQLVKFLRSEIPQQNCTFVSRRRRVGSTANHILGIRTLCSNPETVICTVDLDDALLGRPMSIIQGLYKEDPQLEAAFGGCVHVHKSIIYQIDDARPVAPRDTRGQPFFTHFRTFRKSVFDQIRKDDLEVNEPFSFAADWAFCIPIWERAVKVKALTGELYLYEPSSKIQRDVREHDIKNVMSLPPYSRRRFSVSVIGDASHETNMTASKEAFRVGFFLAKAGYTVVTGGLGGVMEAACRGAKLGRGITIGILPGSDPRKANPHVDIVVPTDMGRHRNGIIALSDAVVVVGGRSGTRLEAEYAWSEKRLIIALERVPGCSSEIAGLRLDSRLRFPDIPDDIVYCAKSAEDVIALVNVLLPRYQRNVSRL